MSEAELLADIVEQLCVPNTSQPAKAGKDAAAELRRLHAETEALRAQLGQGVPDGWQPTAENVNALPAPVRRYIHDLVSNADPAGTVRDLTIAQDTIRELEFSNRLLRDACNEVVGCFNAAEVEGLQEALSNTTDERLKDLVERRLMYALYACQSLASAPPAPQAAAVQLMQAFRTSFAYDVGFKDGHQAAKKSDGCGRCTDGTSPADVLQSVWNAMQNSADGDDLLSKLEHMRESIGRAALASAT